MTADASELVAALADLDPVYRHGLVVACAQNRDLYAASWPRHARVWGALAALAADITDAERGAIRRMQRDVDGLPPI